MGTFKDILNQDLELFFNVNEFAETHVIDGKNLTIIVDYDKLDERKQKSLDGESIGEILYFVKSSEFGELPEVDTPQNFDGRNMYVSSANEENGVYEIILKQNRGY